MAEDVVVGLDQGGTSNNATVLDGTGRFLTDALVESPSLVREGPERAVAALVEAFGSVLEQVGVARDRVTAVGLDTPGPASAEGVISSRGSTNFVQAEWRGFDVRRALEEALGLPVVYTNDGNAAAFYAHQVHFATDAEHRSSVAAIVGTGLGGGVVQDGRVIGGAAGMAGELGHVHIPMQGLLAPDQPLPECNCGFTGDAESVASLTGLEKNLLPYWLQQYPGHPLADLVPDEAAKLLRRYGEGGDELALTVFGQQARAIGALFTVVANLIDPHAYFVGGGIVQAEAHFGRWFLEQVRKATYLRDEQAEAAAFALVPDLDMAGARGAAIAAAGADRDGVRALTVTTRGATD